MLLNVLPTHAARPRPAGRRCGYGVLLAAWCALLVFLPGAVEAASTLDEWRSEAGRTRILAENDVPRAYKEAQRLQASLPADVTPADQARVLNLLARTELYLALTEQAAQHARQAMELAKQNGDRVGQAEADLVVALNVINQGRIGDAAAATNRALAVLDGVDRPDLLAEAMLRTSMMYRRKGQFDESVTMSMQQMEIAKRVNTPLVMTYAHQGMGISYDHSGHPKEAREHFNRMLEQARKIPSQLLEADALLGLGSLQNQLGEARVAEATFRQAIAIYRSVGGPFYLARGLFTLGDFLLQQRRHAEAVPLFSEAAALWERHANRIGLWWTLKTRSETWQALGRLDAAQADAERSHALAKEVGVALYLGESAKRLAAIAAVRGNYGQAYRFSAEAMEMADRAERERAGARMLELTERYETESKQREINELTRRNEQQTTELRQRELQQRWLWTLLGGSFAILGGSAYFLLRLRRKRNEIRALNAGLEQRVMVRTAELFESRQSLAEAQRIAHVGSWENNLVDNVLSWSDETYRIFEIDPQRFSASYEAFMDTVHPDDRSMLDRSFKASLENREPFEIEHRLQLPNGRIKYVHERCETVYDHDGNALRSIGTVHDITERKRMEVELRASRNFLDRVIDSVPDPIFVKDREHRWILLNDATCKFGGLPREALIGKSDYDFFPKEQADVFWEKDELVFESGEVNLNEGSFTTASGEEHYIQTKKTPFIAGDGRQMLVGVIRDITDLKQYEAAREMALAEAQRLANLRSEFIAHMSHELRTPLNGILGYAQMLGRDGKLDEKQHASINVIRQSGEHLLALIDDILDLARIESGKLELDMSDIPLARFLNVVAEIIGVRARQKHIMFACEFAQDLPEGIRGDERRLRQVLFNLLSNAVKFTDQGKVTLSVSRASPSRLAFAVKDTGIGIEQTDRETIFQSFEQVSDGQHRLGGTGLGLSISRQLVRLMGGDIVVESRVGYGSTFRFELELPEASIEPEVLHTVFADMQRIEVGGAEESAEPLVAPPKEEIEELRRLALQGNMRDIVNYAERIDSLDPCYRPFGEHLKGLANGYRSKAILAFVEEHLE